MKRECRIKRKTKETDISLYLCLDGKGSCNVDTGVGFFDHMLETLCLHGGFDMELSCKGDLTVDCHHTVEDVGIVLGTGFAETLGDKKGIRRYGMFSVPMDEALAICNLDICNRPYLVFNVDFNAPKIGDLDTQMVKEFFYAFAMSARVTLHLNLAYGENDHHIAEALFKAFGHALKQAVAKAESDEVLSTKGSL